MKPTTLSTKRLILRRAESADSENLFHHYSSDTYSARFLTRKPHSHIDQTNKFLAEWCDIPWDHGSTKFAWIIALADTNRGIGIFLVELENTFDAQIHYGICPNFSRKGFATEAGKVVVEWLTSQQGIHKIWTACDLTHITSIRVLEKLGFLNNGIRKNALNLPAFMDSQRDCYIYTYDCANR